MKPMMPKMPMTPCSCKSSLGKFKSFEDVENYLNCLGMFHMDLGLGRMEKAKELLGLRLMCPVIQVVGTNGKGSTSTFLHSIALAYGFRAGVYTSPHFVTPLERIKMNDRLLPKAAWASLAIQATEAVPDLTYFELLTVMSVMAFMYAEPDILIYEAGLGAKNDATTSIPAQLIVFTPIALDHTNLLGKTLAEIAEEKSHAIREGVRAVISAPQDKNVESVLKARCQELNVPFYTLENTKDLPSCLYMLKDNVPQYELGLKGEHQYINAQTAMLAWYVYCSLYKKPIEAKALEEGLATAFIPGRFQQVKKKNGMPALVLDGAHNLHSLDSLTRTLEHEKIQPSAFVFSCLNDKNPQEMVKKIEAYLKKHQLTIPVFVTQIQENERAVPLKDLEAFFSVPVQIVPSLAEVLEKLPEAISEDQKDNPCVICGSLYLLSEYYRLYPEKLQLSY